jgi:hypothetical protein
MGVTFPTDSAWKTVALGAGGWLVGIDVAPDGTMVVRTDTYGAYIWNGAGWTQLVTAASMPDGSLYSASVYELRIAASNTNIMYLQMSDGIYKTNDKGVSWTKTSFPVIGTTSGDNRMDGQKMAVDPNNPNIVFAGTQKDGLWVTRDGGSSWQKIAAVPQGTSTNDAGMTGISIQGSTVYVGTAGSGVYQSSDGGLSWKAIGGPADLSHAVLTKDGTYLASDNSGGALWKYSGGTWTKVIASGVHAIASDPFDSKHVVVSTQGGSLQESRDGGSTWSGWQWTTKLEASADIPWLENSGTYMSTGGIVFDPLVPGKLWQSAGVGVWETQLPTTGTWDWATQITWNSHSKGIEQLVTNDIIAPSGGNPVFASWDRPFFEMGDLDSYATTYGGGEFSMGWSVDYASSTPSFLVGISDWFGPNEHSGFSSDGGKTWQKFEGLPSWALNTVGGSIAASTTKNFIWVAAGNQAPAYTLDGGKTWSNVSIEGVTNWSQMHSNWYLSRTTITADRVQPNTFYLYDTGSGVYRTTDGGVSWTKMFNGQVGSWTYWNAKIEAVPGSAGELYFTSGPQGSDQTNLEALPLMHSTDGGATWTSLNNVKVATFGYGAPATAGGPATVYIVGFVNGEYGIWYSADTAKNWTKIGEHPMGSLDLIKTISGDMDKFGLVYVGFGGSGYAYLDFSGAPTTPAPNPVTPPPSQVGVIVSALDDVGAAATVGNGAVVNDSTPTLSGTLSSALNSGQKLSIFRDGQLIGQVAPASTSWSFTDPGAGNGKHDYVVRVVDSLGQGGSTSAAFSLNIDTVAPTQAVSVTGVASTGGSLDASSLLRTSLATTSATTAVNGTVGGTLAEGESVVVFRDGVRLGNASVSNGNWSFNDGVTSGSFKYTAQIVDAAGNVGQMSNVLSVSLGSTGAGTVNVINGTTRDDVLVGTSGADKISGVPSTGGRIGKGTVDALTGGAGNDVFVLGDSRGRFYDDGSTRSSGSSDYVRITDFSSGDKLQLKGSASEYLQGRIENLHGYSGTGIYHDSNNNGILDHRDELIALVQNHGPIDLGGFIFV